MVIYRSEMDELRVRIADAETTDELRALAEQLHAALDRARAETALLRDTPAHRREIQYRGQLAELLLSARASYADYRDGAPAPFTHLRHALDAHGWLPPAGATSNALLADVTSLREVLDVTRAA